MARRLKNVRRAVNLLPWRQAKAQRQLRAFMVYMGAFITLGVSLASSAIWYGVTLEECTARTQASLDNLQMQLEHQQAKAQDLQGNLPTPIWGQGLSATQMAQLLDLLTQLPFEKGYLTAITLVPSDNATHANDQGSTQLSLKGVAFSSQEINAIEQTLGRNKWLNSVTLPEISQHDQRVFFIFSAKIPSESERKND